MSNSTEYGCLDSTENSAKSYIFRHFMKWAKELRRQVLILIIDSPKATRHIAFFYWVQRRAH